MKSGRRFLISAAVFAAALVVVLLVIVTGSGFQTWAVKRYLAGHPDVPITLERIEAGRGHVAATNVRLTTDRVHLELPRLEADLDVLALLLHHRCDVTRVVAQGWTCEWLRNVTREPMPSAAPVASPKPEPGTSAGELRGLLPRAQLPLATTVGEIDLDGTVKSGAAVAKVHLTGGGFGPARTGTVRYTIDAERVGAGPTSVRVAGSGSAAMGADRELTDVQLRFEATGAGGKLGQPVTAEAQIAVTRTGNVERYQLSLAGKRPLVTATAELAEGARSIRGNWSIDLSNADVEPFALGRPLPMFSASGAGKFEADTSFTASRITGTIAMGIDRLGVLGRPFDEIGAIEMTIDTDLAQHGTSLSVSRFDARVTAANSPVARARALQSFSFDPATRALQAADANAPLLGVTMDGIPLRWLKPFLGNLSVDGRALSGEVVVTPRAGGLSFATRGPLSATHLSFGRDNVAWLKDVDVSAAIAGDYLPQGWQVECRDVTVRTAAGAGIIGSARVGRLTGANQLLKTTGQATIDFGALREQPAAASLGALSGGSAHVEVVGAIGSTTELQSTVELKDLTANVSAPALPNIKCTLRTAVAPDGRLTWTAPFQFARAGHVSDLTVSGSSQLQLPLKFEATVTSANLALGDLAPIGAFFRSRSPSTDAASDHPWSTVAGTAALDLKHVTAGGAIELSNVTGTIRFGAGAVTFENIRGSTPGGGEASVVAAVRQQESGLELRADVAATELDAAPWFRAIDPQQPPTIEGRFTVTSKLVAHSATLAQLPPAALGEVQCTSKGGIFRGLSVNVGNLVENSSKLSAWLAAAGDAIKSPFIGRKDQDEITSRAQAANELARLLSNVAYDQLGVVVLREEADVARVKEFTLISPELRIRGAGVARRERGMVHGEELIDLDLTLRARGRTAELMKYLGILGSKTDDLGYAACTIPVHVQGAIDRPDTTQLSNRLVALAVEKTGLTEKAVDWINRLRGKSAN